jgi:hypothetical protein
MYIHLIKEMTMVCTNGYDESGNGPNIQNYPSRSKSINCKGLAKIGKSNSKVF